MNHLGNDRWEGRFSPNEIGRWRYSIEAWTDLFATWRRDLIKRLEAGQDVSTELEEGAQLLAASRKRVPGTDRAAIDAAIEALRGPKGQEEGRDARVTAALDEEVFDLMAAHGERHGVETMKPPFELTCDRERARFSAWYELFPRSTGSEGLHGTLDTATVALARVADLGFDVVYLPPIHPIGSTDRKGRNNTLDPGPDDVGVPWAIGSEHGGHTAVHPDLGTIDDFDMFVKEADRLGLEVALDFAIQASPDHPWVKAHPDWFLHRPDGSIRYAENPPKKYQDVYPINFDTNAREGLWKELKGIVDFWIAHGVKIFRVDNPHTKPFAFWEWLIGEVQTDHPDVIFLAEAFTRPKVMKQLAKLGFTQSYTYFTWRNTKPELAEYFTELTQTAMADYFRPNFFTNTPDILHEFLQVGGPPAFKIRLVLAALSSPSYGIYSGYELFENEPVSAGSEEYLHSEKYELRSRDFDRQPNLNAYIKRINEIRGAFPVCRELANLRVHNVDKDRVIAFSKTSPGEESLLVVVNLNPFHWEEATVDLDLSVFGLDEFRPFEVHDLISRETFVWRGPRNYVRLDPREESAHVFHIRGQQG